MLEVVEFIKAYGWQLIFGIVVVYNTIMSIINAAKSRRYVKFSDIIIESDVDSLALAVKNLSKDEQLKFITKLKEVTVE